MKKVFATILVSMMLIMTSISVCAEVSPTADKVTEEETDKSPKTGDLNILLVGFAGVACAGTAVAAAKKSKAEA